MFNYIVDFLMWDYLQTMSVLSVMRSLRSEVDAGVTKPYSFVEINGLKLATPENIYRVLRFVVVQQILQTIGLRIQFQFLRTVRIILLFLNYMKLYVINNRKL